MLYLGNGRSWSCVVFEQDVQTQMFWIDMLALRNRWGRVAWLARWVAWHGVWRVEVV